MANSVDPDEKAHYKPSNQDLLFLHKYDFWSTELKGLKQENTHNSLRAVTNFAKGGN